MTRGPRVSQWCAWLLGPVLALLLSVLYGASTAGELSERRVAVGLKVFPTLLAADQELQEKRGEAGALRLLVVYWDDRGYAEGLADQLRDLDSIRGLPLEVEVIDHTALPGYPRRPVAGVFLGQPLPDGPRTLAEFGRTRGVVVFSPFEGDVERGVLGGISVTDRILPFINRASLTASGLSIKPFYLRIADVYE